MDDIYSAGACRGKRGALMLRATGKSVSYERAFYPIDLSFRWHKVQRIRARIRYTHRSAPKLILLGKPNPSLAFPSTAMPNPFNLVYPASFSENKRPIPTPEDLLGDWHIIYTSLSFWKDKRNVKWTFASSSGIPITDLSKSSIDDTIAYHSLFSSRIKTIKGTNTPSPNGPGAWDWRASGSAQLVNNRWELLGYGDIEGVGEWMAAFSEKGLFNPASVTFSMREKGAFSEGLREEFDAALRGLEHRDLEGLVEGMARVRHD